MNHLLKLDICILNQLRTQILHIGPIRNVSLHLFLVDAHPISSIQFIRAVNIGYFKIHCTVTSDRNSKSPSLKIPTNP